MLVQYLTRTRLLLSDPDFAQFNDEDLREYVNMARGQIAGQAECVRVYATLAVTDASQQYNFSAINLGGAAGVQGVLNVRQISFAVASGYKMLTMRPFPWFNQFVLSQPVPEAGVPATWSQFAQGANGSIFINLLDGAYTLSCDCACYPIDLVNDSTAEAIPFQWTDAVPLFSAYYAAMTAQNADKAKAMYSEYQTFMARARANGTSAVLPTSFAQAQDPFMPNRLGLQQRGVP